MQSSLSRPCTSNVDLANAPQQFSTYRAAKEILLCPVVLWACSCSDSGEPIEHRACCEVRKQVVVNAFEICPRSIILKFWKVCSQMNLYAAEFQIWIKHYGPCRDEFAVMRIGMAPVSSLDSKIFYALGGGMPLCGNSLNGRLLYIISKTQFFFRVVFRQFIHYKEEAWNYSLFRASSSILRINNL